MKKAIFYHAGCPICVDAERNFLNAIDPSKWSVDIVHLGEEKDKITSAENEGVKSVPALVMDGTVYHINYGASLDNLR